MTGRLDVDENGIGGTVDALCHGLNGLLDPQTFIVGLISQLVLVLVSVVTQLLSEHFVLALDATELVHDVGVGVVVAEETLAVQDGDDPLQHWRFDFHVAET